MGVLDKIRSEAKKAGANKGKLYFSKDGTKRRVRFLSDMEEGKEIIFHDSFEKSINVPCRTTFGRDCELCEDEDLRTRSFFVWSVFDYDAKEVKLFLFPVNNCSPVPSLMAFYDQYGTLTDRDYVISQTGTGTGKTFAVIPMDKVKFRNEKAKAYSEKKLLEIVDKAFPYNGAEEDDDEDEEEKPKKSKAKSKSRKKEEPEEIDYDEMTAKELYKLCQERDIEVKQKKDEEYYIEKLQEWDEENEGEPDWNEDDDEGDEESVDYTELTAKELYKLCKERKIDCQAKKSEKYYIKLLEEYDSANEDWEEDDEDDIPF